MAQNEKNNSELSSEEEGPEAESSTSEDENDGASDANQDEIDGDGTAHRGESEEAKKRQEYLQLWKDKLKAVEDKLNDRDYVKELGENEEQQSKFLADYERYISEKPPEKHDNVLHLMAGNRGRTCPWLIKHVLKHWKDRMKDLGYTDKQPLILAITSRKEVFIKAVLRSEYDDEDLNEILGKNNTDGGTGIHEAINYGITPSLIIKLIKKVSDEVLCKKDGSGRTPLHVAVEYGRCTAEQVNVVKALLDKGDSALDVATSSKNLKVYRYHFDTRPKSQDASAATRKPQGVTGPPGQPESVTTTDRDSTLAGAESARDQGDKKAKQSLDKSREKSEGIQDKKEKNTSEQSKAAQPLSNSPSVAPANDRPKLGRVLTGQLSRNDPNSSNQTPTNPTGPTIWPSTYQSNEARKALPVRKPQDSETATTARAPAASRAEPSGKEDPQIDTTRENDVFADQIAYEIKLRYLRSTFVKAHRSHDSAVEFLYGETQSRHICFNLLDRIGPVQKENYREFNFDNVLQFVAIGPGVTPKSKSGDKALAPGSGRRDLLELFKWFKKKGVKHIIKVIVVENYKEYPCHSDEAIIEALSHFTIETLDWSKPDLCPETIKKACKSVRELHLSWSGLNGMLLAWGGSDGLANLPNLTDIYLTQTVRLESEKWTDDRLKEFKNRLKRSRKAIKKSEQNNGESSSEWKTIKVHPLAAQDSGDLRQATEGVAEDPHKDPAIKDHQWLEIMDEFADGLLRLNPEEYIKKIPNLPADLLREVRICLIDDGVDKEHKSVSERMDRNGKAFGTYSDNKYRGMPMPFYDSTTDHGTLMASMIARVCPYAKIVSYRLDTRQGADKRLHFTAKSAAEAVEHAAKQPDFDIISMSWTVKEMDTKDEKNKDDIARLREALEKAAKKKLLFCSAPDVGAIPASQLSSYYPIGSGVSNIFGIGAAMADYSPWLQAGGSSVVTYTLPGQDVRERNTDIPPVRLKKDSLRTGSSVATALAAGLAALVIYVVRIAAIRAFEEKAKLMVVRPPEQSKEAAKSLSLVKSPARMRKIFDRMKSSKEGQLYVHVWDDFNGQGNLLKTAGDGESDARAEAERWRIISELALRFTAP